MGTGYTRQDSGNNIDNGQVVDADVLDSEFDALVTAFNSSSGHTHDGTTAEGGPVTVLGPAQEYVANGTAFYPKADNTYDLGTAAFEWKDLYIDGTANIDSLAADAITVSGLATFNGAINATSTSAFVGLAEFDNVDINGGAIDNTPIGATVANTGVFTTLTAGGAFTAQTTLSVLGNSTFGNAATDTVTFTADIASDFIPSTDNAYDIGAVGSEWKDLFINGTANIDSLVADTADINGGTIDGAIIGGSSSAAGTFTTVTASGTVTMNGDVDLGNASTDSVTFTGRVDSDLLPIADSTHDLGSSSLAWAEIHADNIIVGGESLLPVENTWTVEITAGAVTSATTVTGYYYTLGDIVFCGFNTLNNISTSGMTGTDFIRIGLPFTARAGYTAVGSIVVSSTDSGTSSQSFVATVTAGQNYAVLRYQGGPATAATPVVVNDINSASNFDINFFSMVFMKA